MEKIELLEAEIKRCKDIGKPNDSNTALIVPKDGKTIMTLFAGDMPKYTQKLGLFTFMKMHNDPEIIFTANCWMSVGTPEDIKNKDRPLPSEDPNRTEAFVIHYFTKDKEAFHMLSYKTKDDGDIEWTDEHSYLDKDIDAWSGWNPYKFSPEELEEYKEALEMDAFDNKAKVESFDLMQKFKLELFTQEDKYRFKIYNAKGECFFSIKPAPKEEGWREKLDIVKDALAGRNFDALKKMMEEQNGNREKN